MSFPVTVNRKITSNCEVRLTRELLLSMLREHVDLNVPDEAQVTVRIPGGGDWSNENLAIDGELPIVVSWTTVA